MGARDVARDRKTEPGAPFVLVASIVKPQKRLEYILAQLQRDAGSVVVHGHRQPAMIAVPGDRHRRSKTRGVADKIGETALERGRANRDVWLAVEIDARRMTVPFGVGFQIVQKRGDVGRPRLLAHVAARKGEISLEHSRHLVDVLLDGVDFGAVAEQGEFKLKARQNGAQIVRHAGQHRGALLDGALDACFHFQEGRGSPADFPRAARPEVRRLAALAEGFGGVGQADDRANLIAQEGNRNGEHDQRSRDHPKQKDPGIRIVDIGAAGEHPHHRVVELNADFHDVGTADGVDPEWQADLFADFVRQRAVKLREEWFRAGRRQLASRQEIDHEAESVLRNASKLRVVGVLRKCLVDVDEGGDFLRDCRGQIGRHQIPVPLQEEERDDRLQHDHGHDDDQERTGIKPFRHHRFHPTAEPIPGSYDRGGKRRSHAGHRIRGGDQLPGGIAQPSDTIIETGHDTLTSPPPGGSRRPARSGRSADCPGRARSCGAGD